MALPPPPPPPPLPSDSTISNSSSSTATSSSSVAAASSSDMLNYLWIPFLISLSKELNNQSTAAEPLLSESERNAFATVTRFPEVDQNLNFRPVIGILSHPGDGASGRINDAANVSYIAASYVKFVESAGARVIPLIYNEPWEVLCRKLNLVNGVIFTGGRDKRGVYFEVVESIFKEVLRKNDAGDHFPLLAICLGFELLTKIVSEDNTILERFNAKDQASTLLFMENTDINGTLFQRYQFSRLLLYERFPPALLEKLSTECLVMQNHTFGISPEKFQENKRLSSFFKILTTSADEDGKVYVSTVQACRYPVTAVQWHPEEARKSMNRPSPQNVLDNLIYNYSPTYCGKAGRGLMRSTFSASSDP